MQPKISLQTFTIRKHTKSPEAIENALAKVRGLGISAIELAYIKLKRPEIKAVARACKEHGITVGSSQITYDFLNKNKDWVVEFHRELLDCAITSVSVLPQKVITGNEDAMLRFAEELNQLGEYYRDHGIQLCFHHHDFEFRRYGENTGLELLMENTTSENIGLIIDCYWAQRGGKTPQNLIRDQAGRVQVIHLRDYSVKRTFFEMTPFDTELGNGNLELPAIIEACKESQVRYMAIEHNSKAPYDSIERSTAYLRNLGYGDLF